VNPHRLVRRRSSLTIRRGRRQRNIRFTYRNRNCQPPRTFNAVVPTTVRGRRAASDRVFAGRPNRRITTLPWLCTRAVAPHQRTGCENRPGHPAPRPPISDLRPPQLVSDLPPDQSTGSLIRRAGFCLNIAVSAASSNPACRNTFAACASASV